MRGRDTVVYHSNFIYSIIFLFFFGDYYYQNQEEDGLLGKGRVIDSAEAHYGSFDAMLRRPLTTPPCDGGCG